MCSNYRGITLTSQVAKLFERMIERKIRPLIEEHLTKEQYGFRKGRSTTDLVFACDNWQKNTSSTIKHYGLDF